MNSLAGRIQHAMELQRRAISIYERTGPLRELADAVNNLGIGAYALRDIAGAEALWLRSAELWREEGDPRGEAGPIHNLADVWLTRGDTTRASAYVEESMALALRSASSLAVAYTKVKIAELRIKAGDWLDVKSPLFEGMIMLRDVGDQLALLGSLENVAALWLHESPPRPVSAARLLGAADRSHLSMDSPLQFGEQTTRTETEAELRATLGTSGWELAVRDGAVLDLNAAVAYALGEIDPFTLQGSLDEGPG